MVNSPITNAARIADILTRYTNRTIIEMNAAGELVGRQPSLRSIERATGIAHQRISEFLRSPEQATGYMLGRMLSVIESPELVTVERSTSGRVAYADFPSYSPQVTMRIPAGAAAYRFVIQTDDETYKGFRSSEWLGDFENMDELADSVPGGRGMIERIVFDVGD